MKITLVRPRSVGKSTIGKLLSKKLKYTEGDKLMHKKLKKHGGLDKVIKSRKSNLIAKNAIPLIKKALKNKSLILDLAGGAISSRKHKKISKQIINLIKKESILIGLLPSKNNRESIKLLFNREKKRKHFLKINKKELQKEVKKDYLKLKPKIKKYSNIIVYTKNKKPIQIINEINKRLK